MGLCMPGRELAAGMDGAGRVPPWAGGLGGCALIFVEGWFKAICPEHGCGV